MIATIAVEGLEIECIIGVLPTERETPQVIFVDVEIDRDISAAVHEDDVARTVDYVEIARLIQDVAQERKFQLIETLAEVGAKAVLDGFGAERAKIKIMKPSAIPAASWAAVTVERRA